MAKRLAPLKPKPLPKELKPLPRECESLMGYKCFLGATIILSIMIFAIIGLIILP